MLPKFGQREKIDSRSLYVEETEPGSLPLSPVCKTSPHEHEDFPNRGEAAMARDRKDDRRKTISKYLSLHLRHQPEALGLELGPGGWVAVALLLAGAARNR